VKLTAIILTFNEALHLERCLKSVQQIADEVVVVDCFSTDTTVELADNFGATVLQHEWTNHAQQFNWALEQISVTGWILRLDADEYLTSGLIAEIRQRLPVVSPDVDGIFLKRMICFQGRSIRFGGAFSVPVLRLFRYRQGVSENRWMDEHIQVVGKTTAFQDIFIDDNLNPLSWWIDKHNRYASLEAVEILNHEYNFLPDSTMKISSGGRSVGLKRWIKENIYLFLPGGLRAALYFLYRYIMRLGFLDGKTGFTFHFLQGFWYRYLVDAKVFEVKRCMKKGQMGVRQAIESVLDVKV